ncbi:hypothetical protein G6F57_023254 [Rhizopus arrhizus]|nr:hypothetical protein G6F57_023254 [Rhizopus arrhizus]
MMLTIESAQSGYGASQVLFGVDLQIGAGQVVTLLGRNGMGKTTLLRTLTSAAGARTALPASAWPSSPKGGSAFPT